MRREHHSPHQRRFRHTTPTPMTIITSREPQEQLRHKLRPSPPNPMMPRPRLPGMATNGTNDSYSEDGRHLEFEYYKFSGSEGSSTECSYVRGDGYRKHNQRRATGGKPHKSHNELRTAKKKATQPPPHTLSLNTSPNHRPAFDPRYRERSTRTKFHPAVVQPPGPRRPKSRSDSPQDCNCRRKESPSRVPFGLMPCSRLSQVGMSGNWCDGLSPNIIGPGPCRKGRRGAPHRISVMDVRDGSRSRCNTTVMDPQGPNLVHGELEAPQHRTAVSDEEFTD